MTEKKDLEEVIGEITYEQFIWDLTLVFWKRNRFRQYQQV
jgi:hypothetical protein